MGLALEFKHYSSLKSTTNSPLFLLAHLEPNSHNLYRYTRKKCYSTATPVRFVDSKFLSYS
jgi:hypothetical protein